MPRTSNSVLLLLSLLLVGVLAAGCGGGSGSPGTDTQFLAQVQSLWSPVASVRAKEDPQSTQDTDTDKVAEGHTDCQALSQGESAKTLLNDYLTKYPDVQFNLDIMIAAVKVYCPTNQSALNRAGYS